MKKTAKIGLVVLLLALLSLNTYVTAGDTDTPNTVLKTDAPLPLPPDPGAVIIKPGLEIPPQLAAFSGAWFGRWDEPGGKDHILVIEQIESPERIIAIISNGAGHRRDPRWHRAVGKFEKNELVFELRNDAYGTYEMRGDTLRADYYRNKDNRHFRATMKRIDLNSISNR